jgi:translocation and assembly module TamA
VLRWVCVLVLAIGCGGRARVHAPNEVWLSSIRIKGNKSIPEDDLIPGLAIDRARRDGQRVDPYQLGLDTKRIRGAYTRMGFFEVKVDSRIEREDNAEIVYFTVDEGPRAKARVSVTGLPPELPEEVVLAKLELQEGAPFDYELYDDGKEIVRGMVEDAGYPHVDLEESVVTVDRKTREAAASYRVVLSGPRAVFGKVTVIGLSQFPDLELAIMGRLQFREGELYSPRAIADTQRALYDLGRFAQVRVDPDKSALTETVPITIAVSVAGRHELKGGGGVGYEPATYEARLRGGFSYVPEEYPLLSFGFDGRLALSVDHAFADFEPRLRLFFNVQRLELFRPYVIGDLGAGLEYFTLESYTARGPILRTGLTAPLGARWLTAQIGWNFSYFEFFDVSPIIGDRDQVLLGLRDNERNGRFEQSITADLRDKPLEPRKGAYLSLRIIEGGTFAGGAFNYLEFQPDLRGYLPIGSQSALAFRVRGGAFFGGDRDVPMTQRYFSGGAQNHRGFTARGLTPTILGEVPDPDNPGETKFSRAPIGGEAFVETGAELRVPIGELFGLLFGTTVFLDGGDVVDQDDGLDLLNLHWAAGIGVFVKYGGFKIRIDVGQRLNRIGPLDPDYDPDGLLKNTNFFFGVGETY